MSSVPSSLMPMDPSIVADAGSSADWLGTLSQGLSLGTSFLPGVQALLGGQQQQAGAEQAARQAAILEQQAAAERAQAEYNARMLRRQREMEKAQERRSYDQELARARVGGVSAESLLASADRFSLSTSQKDWLTGQQAQNMLDSGAQRSSSLQAQAASYGARARSSYGGLASLSNLTSLLAGGAKAMSSVLPEDTDDTASLISTGMKVASMAQYLAFI